MNWSSPRQTLQDCPDHWLVRLATKQDSILVDEIRINALRGIDLPFEASEVITFEGRTPDGSINRVTARLVTPEAYLALKSL